MKKILLILLVILLTGCVKTNRYYCPKDYTEKEDHCEKVVTKLPTEEHECSSAMYSYDKDRDICVNQIKTAAIYTYECPAGYTLYGVMCKKTGGVLNLSKCGANHVYIGGYCYQDILGTATYKCYTGKREGSLCVTETTISPTIKLTCEEGYTLENNMCSKLEIIDKLKK